MRRSSDTIRVLHVDDKPDFAEMVATFLEREDDRIEVRTATSPEEALEGLDTDEIDCIVSDFDMPHTNGIEFLETVREGHPNLPFILYTGKGSEEVASDAISAGVTDYLQKEGGSDQYTILSNRITNAVDRYRARHVLEETRERNALFIEQSPLGVIEWNDAFEIVRVNETAEGILGYSESELCGSSWERLVPESDRDDVGAVVAELLEGEGGQRSVNENVTADGEQIVCEWHNRVITDDDGDVVTIFSQFQDITDQKERERALRRERDRFKTLFETLPVPAVRAVIEHDRSTVKQVNPAFEETFGYDTGTVEGTDIEEYVAPGSLAGSAGEINQALRETGRVSERVRRQTADGVREFQLEAALIDPSTSAEGYAIYVPLRTDGTGSKDPDAKEAKIERLHDVAVALKEVDDVERVYEQVVAAAEDILAFDYALADTVEDGKLVPTAIAERLDEDAYYEATPVDAEDNIAAEVFRTGEPSVVEDLAEHDAAPADPEFRSTLTVPIGKHGVFQAASRETAAFDRTDLELVSLLTTHAEATLDRIEHERELRTRTDRLERQNQRLEKFTSVVSHDLRNPLGVASGRLELLADECESDQIDHIERAHSRMETLIDDLLTLAQEGETVAELEDVSLATAVEQCWSAVKTAESTLVVDVEGTVRADDTRLKQIFENLIRNAVEHGSTGNRTGSDDAVEHGSTSNQTSSDDVLEHGGGGVTVTVGTLEDGFYVEDDGPGIPDSDRDEVFEIGYSTADEGTGFGLSIVKQIVDAHGWEISVTDGSTGGARFEVTGVEFVEQ